jgi:hypothetical protein
LKFLSAVADIPPMILPEEKLPPFVDNNGLILDPMAEERDRKMMNPWTEVSLNIIIWMLIRFHIRRRRRYS